MENNIPSATHQEKAKKMKKLRRWQIAVSLLGVAIINQKFTIVYNYMLETWGINLDDLREIVLRRQQEIPELDLSTIE